MVKQGKRVNRKKKRKKDDADNYFPHGSAARFRACTSLPHLAGLDFSVLTNFSRPAWAFSCDGNPENGRKKECDKKLKLLPPRRRHGFTAHFVFPVSRLSLCSLFAPSFQQRVQRNTRYDPEEIELLFVVVHQGRRPRKKTHVAGGAILFGAPFFVD